MKFLVREKYGRLGRARQFLQRSAVGRAAFDALDRLDLELERRAFNNSGMLPLFKEVLLETVTLCNADCAFCPVSVQANPRARAMMEMELVNKIANELRDIKYTGTVKFYNNNEPLIDKRLPEIVSLFRQTVPGATLALLSNGKLLTKDVLLTLFNAGLNILSLNSYGDGQTLIPPLKNIVDQGVDQFPETSVRIILRDKNEIMTTRGGNAPNKKLDRNPNVRRFCVFPFKQITVDVDGTVGLCCQDVFSKYVVGNAASQTLEEIWYGSPQLQRARQALLSSDRRFCGTCAACDFRGYRLGRATQALRLWQ